MFEVFTAGVSAQVRPGTTEEWVCEAAERWPSAIYFATCELVAGEGWRHAQPFTKRLPHGTVVTGCHVCGVEVVD